MLVVKWQDDMLIVKWQDMLVVKWQDMLVVKWQDMLVVKWQDMLVVIRHLLNYSIFVQHTVISNVNKGISTENKLCSESGMPYWNNM